MDSLYYEAAEHALTPINMCINLFTFYKGLYYEAVEHALI